uniref:tRNA carboxymethyluridine synthase n=1 Tax=viral metagenome TaxID=1070528 RepID=A0A6C0B403_9ZZZZ
MFNESLSVDFSGQFNQTDIDQIFLKGTHHTNVEILPALLDVMIQVATDSFDFKFESYRDYDKFMLKMRRKYQYNLVISKTKLFTHYRKLYSDNKIKRNYQLEKFMRIKGARSRSGVVSVTIFTSGSVMGGDAVDKVKTGGCPMNCHYCPFEKDENGIPTQPRSYLSTEPGNKRATENLHHPLGQAYSRLFQLESIGHISNNDQESNKIELIISGGTFNFYPKDYIIWFSTCAYYACNTYHTARENMGNFDKVRPMLSLDEEKIINETATNRIIGLTVETRPDYVAKSERGVIDFSQIELFRKIGVTRVQIGVQTTEDHILKKINRGCRNKDNIWGIKLLKSNGFKTDIHIMLDLPGSSPTIDKNVIDKITSDPNLQADQWKIYPTETTPFTKIKEWYDEGTYKPYAEDHTEGLSYLLMDVIVHALTKIPEYIRVNRIVRDIPHISIEGGLKCSNFRQLTKQKMDKMGILTNDIREREVKYKNIDWDDMILDIVTYPSSGGIEYFIQLCSKNKRVLYGFIRLRHNKTNKYSLQSLEETALIRELHIYGQHANIGDKNGKTVQHKGLGSRLLKKAEHISRKNGYKKIAVISGVGVRGFYIKKGYTLGEHDYMYKLLPDYKYLYAISMICIAILLGILNGFVN